MLLGGDAIGRLAMAQLPGGQPPSVPPPEASWHQAFGTDIVRRRLFPTRLQQFAAFVPIAPFGANWSTDRFWSFPMPDAIRRRKPMHTGAQQFASYVEAAPFNENIKLNEWFVPFSEPVRFRPRLVTANQWFGRGIEFPLTSSVVSVTATFLGVATVNGVPTSNYKQLLATDNRRKLIYAAEISPWTLSE